MVAAAVIISSRRRRGWGRRSSTSSCACSNPTLPPITIQTPRIWSSSLKRPPSPNASFRYCITYVHARFFFFFPSNIPRDAGSLMTTLAYLPTFFFFNWLLLGCVMYAAQILWERWTRRVTAAIEKEGGVVSEQGAERVTPWRLHCVSPPLINKQQRLISSYCIYPGLVSERQSQMAPFGSEDGRKCCRWRSRQ